ncbi:hypothetical protein QQ020_04565 [Fulvivirgaceae bacterium BMA12]|uniref:Uncharacterized protein n=1 Tax=Agaribacillus aureus TaxID=3051825 RepID=A0ABT8L213_9BACT|nr:hypothetical protein [Fulvivirgaceae bacterium BMA12]
MGYMGFGMRKEVYTRKPKPAFKKIKKIYGKHLDLPKSSLQLTPAKTGAYRQKKSVHLVDTAAFKIFIFLILVGGVLLIMHFLGSI